MDLLGRIREELAFEANVRKSYLYRFLMEFQLWWPIWVIYLQRERGFSLTQITLLDVPFLLLVVLAEVPTGAIADRFGRRTSLMLGSSLFAVAVFIFGIADNYLIILTSYTVWGLALTFQSGADTAILYDSLKSAGREDDFQKINSRLWALRSLSVLVAILIGAPIAAATSFTFAITLSAIIGLAAVPVAFFMHEPRHRGQRDEEPYLETVKTGLRDAWHQPPLRWIILFSGVLVAMTFTPLVFTQPFLDEQGVALGDLGLWQAPVRAAGVVSALFAYQMVSRLGERASFFALPLLIVGALFALGGFNSLWAYGAFVSIGVVAGMHHPTLATYVNRRIPSERRATMLSVQSLTGNLVMAAINPLAGVLADGLGLQGMFITLGAITLVLGPGILLLWLRAEQQAPEPAEERAPATEAASEVVPV